jgi:hypothetical protein
MCALTSIGVLGVLGLLTGCSGSDGDESGAPTSPSPSAASAVPAAVQAFCGRGHGHLRLTEVPVTVPRAECDLAGVVVVYRGAGAQVPERPGGVSGFADGVDAAHSGSISITVTKQDVTIDGGI